MNETKLTPLLQGKNWKNLFYFAKAKFTLLYAVKVTFKQMESLWVTPWASIIRNIYGRTGKQFSSNVIKSSYILETICWRHQLFYKRRFNWIMSVLIGFHPSIQFAYETESHNKLLFLDVLIIRNGQSIDTCVYRESTDTNIDIHWNCFAPIQWKRSTLKTLVYRSYLICSNDHYFTLEPKYLWKVFKECNTYPHWFITQVFNVVNKTFNQQQEVTVTNETTTSEESNSKKQIMKLPYAGEKGCSIIKYLKKDLRKTLPANVEADIISTITKLSSQSNSVKDPTPLEEQHDLIYHSVCNHDYCNDDWFGKQD